MNRTKVIYLTMLIALGACLTLSDLATEVVSSAAQSDGGEKQAADAVKNSSAANQQPVNASRAAREEKTLQDARRQQLSEKEASLAAKELELKKLSAKLESQIKALEESKKQLDDALKAQLEAQKKLQDEKIVKMVKLFKTMRSEQAAKMIDTLKEDTALSLLSRLDTKTVAKLAPFLNQPRVVKWVTQNLQER